METIVDLVIAMILVIGLGNPGQEYSHSRHNVGFDIVDILASRNHMSLTKNRFKSMIGEGMISGKKTVLAKPQTYMNLSGEAVVELIGWYKPERKDLIICYDDIDLPAGKLRLREKGSAGTHNGMRNIISLTGTTELQRLRCGIGKPPENWDLKDWVLCGPRDEEERKIMFASYIKACEIIETWIASGYQAAQKHLTEINVMESK